VNLIVSIFARIILCLELLLRIISHSLTAEEFSRQPQSYIT